MRLLLFLVLSVSAYGQILAPILQGAPASGGGATFSRVGTTGACRISGIGTCTVTMPQTPTIGNLIYCSVGLGGGGAAGLAAPVTDSASNAFSTAVSVADGNNNSYSFAKYRVTTGVITTAIVLTTSGGNASSMVCGEYSRSSGTWTLDVTNTAFNNFVGAGSITTTGATTTGTTDLILTSASVDSAVTTPTWTAGGSWNNFGTTSLATNDFPVGVLADQLNVVAGSYTVNETFAPAAGGIIWTALFVSFK